MEENKKYYYQNGNNFRIENNPLLELPEGYTEITEEEYEQAQANILASLRQQKTPIQEIKEQIAHLKMLLASSDYKLCKYLDGDMTEEDYAPIRQQRHAWRVRINELEAELENEQ